MADQRDPPEQGFPARYTALFLLATVGFIGGGLLLWLPARDGASTAKSDLGLALIGGGLALAAGYLVSRAVFIAQARLDQELRRAEERRERDNQRVVVSMAESLVGADLRGFDLGDVILRRKQINDANLRGANLEGAILGANVDLSRACLAGVNLHGARIGEPESSVVAMIGADLTDANLSDATVIADLRRACLRGADLRGTNLRQALLRHPHPDTAEEEAIKREATDFTGAKYDDRTRWPYDFEPTSAGATHTK